MNSHPYLRAYMAGIVVPTVFLLIVFTGFCIARFVYNVPVPIEKILVFPMALVPNLWGVWNMLYLALRSHRRLPIGFHGALLLLLLGPLGLALTAAQGIVVLNHALASFFAAVFASLAVIYYFMWKYFVSFFNQFLGIA